jgi:NADH dehydrogenase (ubiquinone) flavoprotein 2
MSAVRKMDPNATYQPHTFSFSAENLEVAKEIISRYPQGKQQSAVMPLLNLAQKQNDNWVPKAAMDEIAQMLSMAPMRVYEVAHFYTMYNLTPMGKHHVQLCTTTPCWLRGSDAIVSACKQRLGVELGETTADGVFTLSEVECQGACVNAPMMMVSNTEGDLYYEDLSPESVVAVLDELAAGRAPKAGSQTGRQTSCPANGSTTLKHA